MIKLYVKDLLSINSIFKSFDHFLLDHDINNLSQILQDLLSCSSTFLNNGTVYKSIEDLLSYKYDFIVNKVLNNIKKLISHESSNYISHHIDIYLNRSYISIENNDVDDIYNSSVTNYNSINLSNNIIDIIGNKFEVFLHLLFYKVYLSFRFSDFDNNIKKSSYLTNITDLYRILRLYNLLDLYLHLLEFFSLHYLRISYLPSNNNSTYSKHNLTNLLFNNSIENYVDIDLSITEFVNLKKYYDLLNSVDENLYHNKINTVFDEFFYKSYDVLLSKIQCKINAVNILSGIPMINKFVEQLLSNPDNDLLYNKYINSIMINWNRDIMDLVRHCIINQGNINQISDNIGNQILSSNYDIKYIDKNTFYEMISSIESGDTTRIFSYVEWICNDDLIYVSSNCYVLSLLLFKISLLPLFIFRHDNIQQYCNIIKLYVKYNIDIIQSSVLTYIMETPILFNNFLYNIPILIDENNIEMVLIKFTIFISNCNSIKHIIHVVPHMLQNLYNKSEHKIINNLEYKFYNLESSLMQIQYYFISHFVAFIQQYTQMIIKDDLNNNTIKIIDWLIKYKSILNKYLSNDTSSFISFATDNLLFVSLVNTVDLVLHSDVLSDSLSNYHIYINSIISSNECCIANEVLDNMNLLIKLFNKDIKCMDTINDDIVTLKINEMCKRINQSITSL